MFYKYRWEEPDEHREWREKIEAIEAKASQKSTSSNKEETKKRETVVEYATQADALEAFNTMLDEKKVSSTARSKEVKDLCQDDPRWNALKSSGERNQAIAEYQVFNILMMKCLLCYVKSF